MKRKLTKWDRQSQRKRRVRRAFTARLRKIERNLDAMAQVLLNDRMRNERDFDGVHNKLYDEMGVARRALYSAMRYAPTA